jgi:hypothetical protein
MPNIYVYAVVKTFSDPGEDIVAPTRPEPANRDR